MLSSDEIKRMTGVRAADLVKPGMKIGLGTGSTAYWLIQELGKRVRNGLEMVGVPTSKKTASLAIAAGIPVAGLDLTGRLDIAIDGADEIDPLGQLIKGGGGALLQEKIVASAAAKLVIIADESKLVQQLGKFPLPVEVIPFGYTEVVRRIRAIGWGEQILLRMSDEKPFITDHGHYIIDCHFEKIDQPFRFDQQLRSITGVVETGLFIGQTSFSLIGYADGTIRETMYTC